MSRTLSMLNLAYRFNLHLFRKPFSEQEGKQRFIENYRQDGIVPLSPEERDRLPRFQRCLSCGLCDTVCENLHSAHRHLFNGPSDLASCLSRNPPDFDFLAHYLQFWTRCGDCRRCESICPAGVPLRQIAEFVEQVRSRNRRDDGSLDRSQE